MAPRGRATQQPRGTWRPTNQSSSLPNKMIVKPEKWTQSNAQQNTEQLQNPTTGATRLSLFIATSVKKNNGFVLHVLFQRCIVMRQFYFSYK